MEIKRGELKGAYDKQFENVIRDSWKPCEKTCITCQTGIIAVNH